MLSTLLVGGKDISVVQHMVQFLSLYNYKFLFVFLNNTLFKFKFGRYVYTKNWQIWPSQGLNSKPLIIWSKLQNTSMRFEFMTSRFQNSLLILYTIRFHDRIWLNSRNVLCNLSWTCTCKWSQLGIGIKKTNAGISIPGSIISVRYRTKKWQTAQA